MSAPSGSRSATGSGVRPDGFAAFYGDMSSPADVARTLQAAASAFLEMPDDNRAGLVAASVSSFSKGTI